MIDLRRHFIKMIKKGFLWTYFHGNNLTIVKGCANITYECESECQAKAW